MSEIKEIRVPDIGDFEDVEIIEVHVESGAEVAAEDPLITLETDKAAMDVPSPMAGRVDKVRVSVGDKVSEGAVIVELLSSGEQAEIQPNTQPDTQQAAQPSASAENSTDEIPALTSQPAADEYTGKSDLTAQLVVLGAGPGGYTAAFRAADLGLDVVLVERFPTLGGVCLNVGCIPSKALLHAAKVIDEAASMSEHGISFGTPQIDVDKLRDWKSGVVGRLTKGLQGLAKARKVRVIHGKASFVSDHHLQLEGEAGTQTIAFEQCIIAAGSQPFMLPDLPDDPRIVDSTGALELDGLPKTMLVVGGGIIGLEMACVYEALGVKVSVVELTKDLMPGCDKDLVRPLQKRIAARYASIMLGTKVTGMKALKGGVKVSFDGDQAPDKPQTYDKVLVAVGRTPNGKRIGADRAGVQVDGRGYILVDKQMRTNVPHIFAIGDIVGQPMLAHKASHEAKVAAECAAGHKVAFDARVIPSVAYTDPEIAWVGLTEDQAKADGVAYAVGKFPWAASGRSLAIGRDEGFTKLLFDPDSKRVLGAGIVGTNAGDLIAEAGLAIEMGCEAADIGLTIHPHPTLSESVAMAAEAFDGTLTELYIPKRK
ncbi:MAG: dihydrolipoyl dehydrogenase [Gammaproteobacteria bacterium]